MFVEEETDFGQIMSVLAHLEHSQSGPSKHALIWALFASQNFSCNISVFYKKLIYENPIARQPYEFGPAPLVFQGFFAASTPLG